MWHPPGNGRTICREMGAFGHGKAPVYAVRFESFDDFLVEYTDHIRRGLIVLPLGETLPADVPVRLRVTLPDESVLHLVGSTLVTAGSRAAADCDTVVKLAALSDAQRATMERCLQRTVHADPTPVVTDSRPTVLLVDDSISVRLELGDALRARGLRVKVAANGLDAIAAALKRPPDVILTDVEMPVVDGWRLLGMVRTRKRLAHIPVVFFTGLTDEMLRLRGYKLGVDDYLSKDTPAHEIVARLEGVVTRRSQVRSGPGAAQGLRGDLEHVRLGSVLAFLEAERRTGELHVGNGSDGAVLRVCRGIIEGVEHLGGFDHPHDRVFDLLGWTRGDFEFFALPDDLAPSDKGTPISYLLMEHARRQDEANT